MALIPIFKARTRSKVLIGLAAACATCASAQSNAQAPLAHQPVEWVRAAAVNELHIIDEDGSFPLRFNIHKIDAKGDTVREVIESRDGGISRLVQRNGKPITTEENASERQRLQTLLDDPADFAAHHKKDTSSRNYSKSLVNVFPSAMLFSYTPGQPQSRAGATPEVVIDFAPDPKFKPPTLISNSLTGIEGRMWIDIRSQHVTRVDGRFRHAVDFGWGVLARIYPGGSVEFEQINTGGDHWMYSHLLSHLAIRELLFKTAQENTNLDYFGFQTLPNAVSWQDAVRSLLGENISTQ